MEAGGGGNGSGCGGEEGVEELRRKVKDFIRKEVGADWEDELKVTARFKAFSGQRSDWEQQYLFWQNLIIKVARHLGHFIIPSSEVKHIWFNREGLTPLCLDHVLLEMYNDGDILKMDDLVDPTNSRLFQIFKRIVRLVSSSGSSTLEDISNDLIISILLKEKAVQVVELLAENHWTSSCIITMRNFREVCGGTKEASAVLSYLSERGTVKYLFSNKKDFIEGVKVSLSSGVVSRITSLDYDVLHLILTAEKLQQQIDVIDQRYEISRKSALASLRSGNKKLALRHARESKLASQSREKCTMLLNRVEEVLRIIADAESSKKVAEAIQIGARAIKENNISVEEVQNSLQELDESIDLLKQVDQALESSPLYAEIEDEDIENEFKNLENEIITESSGVFSSEIRTEGSEAADTLSEAMSSIKLTDGKSMKTEMQQPMGSANKTKMKDPELEAA